VNMKAGLVNVSVLTGVVGFIAFDSYWTPG